VPGNSGSPSCPEASSIEASPALFCGCANLALNRSIWPRNASDWLISSSSACRGSASTVQAVSALAVKGQVSSDSTTARSPK
jgi:hypothetical protein